MATQSDDLARLALLDRFCAVAVAFARDAAAWRDFNATIAALEPWRPADLFYITARQQWDVVFRRAWTQLVGEEDGICQSTSSATSEDV